jgi:predicted transglutaminase-like cysteine proteinase
MHAVLLVATVEGEVVLDNLSPWVLPWNEAPYQWLDRQAPGAPTQWVHVGLGVRS